ncbi:Sec14p-like phosphatidylinositol transfer family protein isoform 1 [Tripterygium wilfordii]|uniref:Sec14p-like phosphatidylinositol transfer family protein isoform 1 n=1 Tax=Tripterygium wilfordii TaxID=458696 RepID=A0A7J7CMR7_TRIWF|nr:phosphatidylinositol transfer protein 3-like [Tripterygium wilfordii]KAF5735206.1 Sec14p-like phosphatidylinositol transfer family protein isoform 1 [Tripterygium wilfordii]
MSSKNFRGSVAEKSLSREEQLAKINDVRKMIGPIADKLPVLCSEASISRYLRARNWNTKKAGKMLKGTLKWTLEYKPEKIRWEDIAEEAKTGKIYRADYRDKHGRIVLVMRPGFQNTTSTEGQIRYLVYCMENAVMNTNPDQEQMVWLIDFQQWTMSSISVKVTRETAHVLQDHYPERLGLAILYNPPKIFESFWKVVKPFLETKTYKKVKFVYSDDPQSLKPMEEIFDMDKLECSFGGKNTAVFNYEIYADRMKEDDKKITFTASGCPSPIYQHSIEAASQHTESMALENVSDASDEDGHSCSDELDNLNLERVDKSTQGVGLGCTEVGNDEEEVARETKTSELT